MERAKKFYESVFGVELKVRNFGNLIMAWFPAMEGGAGSTGSLVKVEPYTPSHEGTLVYFQVNNIDRILNKVAGVGWKNH
jgi:predicted enzyme related to lactoylglutathione lyase